MSLPRSIRFPSLVVLAAVLSLTAGACVAPAPVPDPGAVPATWQAEMLASINAHRSNAGVAPLSRCGSLDRAASAHSADQAAHGHMSHTGSDGSNAPGRMEAAGYNGWRAWGENVAAGQGAVASVMSAWMNSTGHRANILNGSYEHVGMGLAHSANGTPYWTQVFGRSGTC